MSRQDSRQIENVKVMLARGANGVGIQSIEKTGTSGLVDTYAITLTDGTIITFDITNGSSIATIEKTGTSGLVDTYTITLTNGQTSTFNVTNGGRTLFYDKNVSLAYGESRDIALDMSGYSYDVMDKVLVFINGLFATNGVDYTIDSTTSPAVLTVNTAGSAGNTEVVNILALKAGNVQPLTQVVTSYNENTPIDIAVTIE